jgi:DNA polymerase III subunit beta
MFSHAEKGLQFMKLTCTQHELSRALSTIGHAVPRRATLPILSTILFTAQEQGLTLSASNGEGLTITCRVKATIEEPGSAALPTKLLTDYIASLQAPQLSLSIQEGTYACHITCGRSSANINGVDPTEFPTIPHIEEGVSPMVMDAVLLKEVIHQVSFAASKDPSRPVFTGMYVVLGDEQLTFVAADAFRVAVRTLAVLEDQRTELLIPAQTMELLARVLPTEGTVEMSVTPTHNQVQFHTNTVDLFAVLLEGTYANYAAVLPHVHTTQAVMNRLEFAAAVKEVASFARDGGDTVRVTIRGQESQDGEPNTLTLEAQADELGNNVSVVGATVIGDDQQEICLNVKYLSDVLGVIEVPEIAFEATSPLRPVVIKPVGPTEYQYVIMIQSTNRTPSPQPANREQPENEPVAATR